MTEQPPCGELHYDRPYFLDYSFPHGLLHLTPGCQACWYYAMLATKNKQVNESQMLTEDTWTGETEAAVEKRYDQLARSVAIIYGLDSPDDFLRYRWLVERQAQSLGFELPEEIWRPLSTSKKD